MFECPKTYVAGHNGLLGSALLRRLKVRGCANVVTRTRAELDLTSQAAVEMFFALERPQTVFMAAGLTGGIGANIRRPAEFMHENLSMQDNVFEAARKYGAETLVFYGSSCVYPGRIERPIREDDLLTGPIEETSAPYALAKMSGIKACKAYNSQYGKTRYIALVPNSMYGPWDSFDPENSHVLASLIGKITHARERRDKSLTLWGTGEPRRELVYCDDVADASIFAVENAERLENTHYNIGTGSDISIKELSQRISEAAGYDGEIRWDSSKPDGTKRKLLDCSRFSSLGWSPIVGLDEGIRRTLEWYMDSKGERASGF